MHMKILFLASKWDEETLTKYLATENVKHRQIIFDRPIDKGANFDLLAICISPASSDSTLFQNAVLKTFENFEKGKFVKIQLDGVRIPIGFGKLGEIETWKPQEMT